MRNPVPLSEHICKGGHDPTGFNPSTVEMEQGQPGSTILKIQAQGKIPSQNNKVGNNRGRHTDTHMHKLTSKENANMLICSKENTYTHTHKYEHTNKKENSKAEKPETGF